MNFDPSDETDSTFEMLATVRLRSTVPDETSNTNSSREVVFGLFKPMIQFPSGLVARLLRVARNTRLEGAGVCGAAGAGNVTGTTTNASLDARLGS